MKNTLKRLLSVLLVLSMLVSLVPAAFATEVTEDESAEQIVTDDAGTTNTEEGSAEPAQDSTEAAAETTEAATEATEVATEATEEATEPVEEATEVTEEATEPTEEATEATEEVTEPTEEATEPTEETTEPTEEVVAEDVVMDEAYFAAMTGANMSAAGLTLINMSSNQLADGVSYDKIVTKNSNSQQNIGFLTRIDLKENVKLKASYKGYYQAGSTAESRAAAAGSLAWGFQTTTGQAAAYASIADAEGTVVMATNGDFFNMGTGEPSGYLIMEGNAIRTKGEPYFAILKDGTAVIRDAGTDHSDVVEAISGPYYLIKDGAIAVGNDGDQAPRNSVGIREDGSIVFYQNDGRQAPTSVGMSTYEVASVLLDEGCVDALYLDGGGSATFAARVEGSDSLKVVNSPSDGAERDVSTAILVISTAEATGVFDHAAITPKDELYTPGSQIQFAAAGVDATGAPAQIPSDVVWALAEESKEMGSIDANGLFTANDKTGEVTVIMTRNGNSVGSATIEIVIPDQIYFNSEEISLGFEDTTDFGLVVRREDRDINYKAGDIVWTTTNDAMGTFNGNLFTASDGSTQEGDVTAASAHAPNVSGTIHVKVGTLPTLVWDFEDVEGVSAEEYYNGLLYTQTVGQALGSFEIVSIDDDEPVRFGEKSLKMNYDFTQTTGKATAGVYIGTPNAIEIPGNPTGIGVWVYAPEGVGVTWNGEGTPSGFWLRGYVVDGSGTTLPYDFTLEPKNALVQSGQVQPGIYWEGWMYLEADLTKMTGPFKIQQGLTFRLMYVPGTGMGSQTANSIYLDNFQFVYGTNVDDVDNPKVDSISVANVELEDGDTLTSNTITVRTEFSDVQNKYTSGVDASTVRMFVDGVNVVDNDKYSFAMNANDGYAELYDLKLADGTHSVTVSLRDHFGNDVAETRYFTVKGGTTASPAVTAAPAEEIAPLGGVVNLEIRASDSTVTNSSTTVRLGNMFPDYEVVFSDNYTGTYKYSKSDSAITITAERKADAAAEDDNLIAKLVVKVPATLTENETFPYEVKSGSYTSSSGYYGTYAVPETKLPVDAAIAVSCDPILVGGDKGILNVTDREGKGVAGAGIYLVSDNTLIGTTDENGQWETDYFSAAAGQTAVYAKTEDGLLSFHYNVAAYDAGGDSAGIPTQIVFNAPADSATQKSISWISNPLTSGEQSIRYRVKDSSNGKQWMLVEADSELFTFSSGSKAADINSVNLTNLNPGTTYEYQVGTSGIWTEVETFTTDSAANSAKKFFVMADIQANDLTNVNNMLAKIKEGGYDFGIQTGDAIDSVASYAQVSEAADLLGIEKLGEMDMVRVLGNHEYYGDPNAAVTSALYNLPESKPGSCYSVTYGDVYVAVINFTNTNAELLPALEWLKADAKASNATWKVLTMHQPPYYTNSVGGNAPIYTYVPDAAEEAGIDVVFSGHDHSLARTNQLTDEQIDEENGILYYICGSSGEKSYSVTSQGDFPHETVYGYGPSVNFNATYVGVTADRMKMELNIYDVAADGSQNVVDTYTLYTEIGACAAAGHELDNAFHSNGMLTCTSCGEEADPAEFNFTGWAVDKATGLKMVYENGVAQIGEYLYGEETYYFDENGIALDGEIERDEVKQVFDNGTLIGGYTGFIKKANGNTYHYDEGKMTYGWYEEDGSWYHFNTETGVMNTQTYVKPDEEAISKNAYYDFGEDGKLLYGYFNPHGYYYWAGLPKVDSWVQLSTDPGAWYHTNDDGHFVTDKTDSETIVIAYDDVEYTFDNSNGKLLKGSIVNKNGVLYYYWAGEPVNDGWFELDGDTYYAYENGRLATGSSKIDDKTYMFTTEGVLVTEGIIMTATLDEKGEKMSIKIANADEALTEVRIAVWPTSTNQEHLQWLDAVKNGEGLWTASIPMCVFEMEDGDIYAIHAFSDDAADELLVETTINIFKSVDHAFTDDYDTTCNICGEELREVETIPMFRLFNPNTGEHFYTGSETERDNLVTAGWNYEGVAWNAPVHIGENVHRVYNPNSGDHHYTMSQEEVNNLIELGWRYEGVAWNSASSDNIPQFRLYNPNADLGSHHYTSSEEERENLVSLGWIFEGIGWYGMLK